MVCGKLCKVCIAWKLSAVILIISAGAAEKNHNRFKNKGVPCGGQPPNNANVTQKTIRLIAREQDAVILTPGHPKSPHNTEVKWIIRTAPETRIELLIENGMTEECCDYIEIRDGPSSKSPLLAVLQGRLFLQRFITVQRFLFIKYVTDDSVQSEGFRAVYNTVPASDYACAHDLVADDTAKPIVSPNWPGTYPNSVFCSWSIRAPPNQQIQLSFAEFFTSGSDVVIVKDGTTRQSPYAARISGWQPPGSAYASNGNTMTVYFVSDKMHPGRGFSATYTSGRFTPTRKKVQDTVKKCGRIVRLPKLDHVTISSPNWPNSYESNTDCTWIINAGRKRKVNLYILYVLAEQRDFVVVRDGCYDTSRKLGSLNQETEVAKAFRSAGNVLRVDFETRPIPPEPRFIGFRAIAVVSDVSFSQFNCEKHRLVSRSSVRYLSSDGWPGSYRFHPNCAWKIASNAGSRVVFRVLHLSTEKCCDYLEVTDGRGSGNGNKTRISGQKRDSFTFVSTGSVLHVRFSMDSSVGYSGFLAYFRDLGEGEDAAWDDPDDESCQSYTCS